MAGKFGGKFRGGNSLLQTNIKEVISEFDQSNNTESERYQNFGDPVLLSKKRAHRSSVNMRRPNIDNSAKISKSSVSSGFHYNDNMFNIK